jgi:hypothetical protein
MQFLGEHDKGAQVLEFHHEAPVITVFDHGITNENWTLNPGCGEVRSVMHDMTGFGLSQ